MTQPSKWYLAGLLESTVIEILRDAQGRDEWLGPVEVALKLGLKGGWCGPAALCVLEMLESEGRVIARPGSRGRVWQITDSELSA